MGGEIIAEKFALVKTRGSNGVAFTHIVEDTLLGERAVVKVSDRFGPLAFDYLKAVNLAREADIPGMLMPFEGGILEEEASFYFAYPEIGEPSLEDYLRAWAPLKCSEALEIILRLLAIVEEMHRAGFVHLFIGARNVFYRPRGEVTLKDPALRAEFFHPLLESIDTPDFSYFSPAVMDGEEPGPDADLYALGRLAERLLEGCDDSRTSPEAGILAWAGERLRGGGAEGASSPADMAAEIVDMLAASRSGPDAAPCGEARSRGGASVHEPSRSVAGRGGRVKQGWLSGRRGSTLALFACALLLVFVASFSILAGMGSKTGKSAGAEAAGGTDAGGLVEAAFPIKKATWGGPGRGGPLPVSGSAEGVGEGSADVSVSKEGTGEESAKQAEEGHEDGAAGQDAGRETGTEQPGATPIGGNAAPVASFSLVPGEGDSPLRVYLDASASYDPDGFIVAYSWSFGASGRGVYHVFESNVIPATVPVTLTVTDDGGNSASTTRYVTLY